MVYSRLPHHISRHASLFRSQSWGYLGGSFVGGGFLRSRSHCLASAVYCSFSSPLARRRRAGSPSGRTNRRGCARGMRLMRSERVGIGKATDSPSMRNVRTLLQALGRCFVSMKRNRQWYVPSGSVRGGQWQLYRSTRTR